MSRLRGGFRRLGGGLATWSAPRWDGLDKASSFLSKPLPRNISWLHTLGSLLLLYLGFQILTGILLGFYYSPSPGSAYESVRYVQEELFLGRWLHHLHRYGSGFILVTVFLHLARSYFLAAYKAPRELLWVTGVLLAVLLTLFAFTGQLLPFDQRGYWATVVGIRIASSAPGLGEVVRQLLTGGYGDIGATTLARFYILHVSVFPLALAGLLGLHLAILQKVGSAGPANDSPPHPTHPFYPTQAVKDVLVAAGGALALCVTAALIQSIETGPANPSATNFTPRPEWYFLSHYEILRFLPGAWQVFGTFVLPNLLLGVLLLLPFVDRGPQRSLRKRKLATGAGLLVCLTIVGLTAQGILSNPHTGDEAAATEVSKLDPVARGKALFRQFECVQCHTIAGEGGTQGPDLTHVAERIRSDYFPKWIRNPRSFKPTTEMPAFEGTEEELSAIIEYLLTLN